MKPTRSFYIILSLNGITLMSFDSTYYVLKCFQAEPCTIQENKLLMQQIMLPQNNICFMNLQIKSSPVLLLQFLCSPLRWLSVNIFKRKIQQNTQSTIFKFVNAYYKHVQLILTKNGSRLLQ